MNRERMIEQLLSGPSQWDICIIGGGATGLGAAIDAASRGYKTILVEQQDFARGTSSRSTKLIHGGVRYLQQGNIKLVMEALHERGLLCNNAPHLIKNQSFILPNYKWWEGPFYGIGLKVYDWMAGDLGLGPSRSLTKEETLGLAPTLDAEGLRGSVMYQDGQFDDARLAINLAQTAAEKGAVMINHFNVYGFQKDEDQITGVLVRDQLDHKTYTIQARVTINATGVFADSILLMDNQKSETMIAPSQGVHIVLNKEFLPGETAILVPHTDDGRVLFAVPWHNKIIIGTTDSAVDAASAEPCALNEEIDFLLEQISRYLTKAPTRNDIRSVFAGLRPLIKASSRKTAELSRDHLITVSASGLVTIAGGKWTTYRRMGEDVIDAAIKKAGLHPQPCQTPHLKIHGAKDDTDFDSPLYYYGTDAVFIQALVTATPEWGNLLHPHLPYIQAEIIWAVQQEMCMTVEDALSRRTRALFLDARAAIESAPAVAALMAQQLGKDNGWVSGQLQAFQSVANNFLPDHSLHTITHPAL